jgi:SAM-dependent methyltransferase
MSVVFEWRESEMAALLETCTRDEVLPLIEKHFTPGSRLLEAGCGAGRWVRFLTDRGYRIVGLEYSSDTVRMVRNAWPDLDVVEGDCSSSPFPAAAFDGVLSFGVVEHFIEGPRAPLQELFRVLVPGGKALITVPCQTLIRRIKHKTWWSEIVQSPRALAARTLKGKPKPLSRRDPRYLFPVAPAWGEFFEYRMPPGEFDAQVRAVGFEIEEHVPIGMMDGIYHDLNPLGLLVKWRNWKLEPSRVAELANKLLAKQPFLHCHMQAIVARKPLR